MFEWLRLVERHFCSSTACGVIILSHYSTTTATKTMLKKVNIMIEISEIPFYLHLYPTFNVLLHVKIQNVRLKGTVTIDSIVQII